MDASKREFFDNVDLNASRVKPYEGFIFLCGGPTDVAPPEPVSIRDALLRELSKRADISDRVRIAENYKEWATDSHYKDLVSFERHLAELSSVIVVVLESAGSIAELGLFSVLDAFKDKLLVFVETEHYRSTSFIRLGLIDYLEKVHSNNVQFHRWSDTSYRPPRFDPTAAASLQLELAEAVLERARKSLKEHQLVESSWLDIALLICEILSLCSALTIRELKSILDLLNVIRTEAQIRQALFILETVKMVAIEPKGDQRFYVAIDEREFVRLHTRRPELNASRFRADQMSHYAVNDRKRFSAIKEARSRHAKR